MPEGALLMTICPGKEIGITEIVVNLSDELLVINRVDITVVEEFRCKWKCTTIHQLSTTSLLHHPYPFDRWSMALENLIFPSPAIGDHIKRTTKFFFDSETDWLLHCLAFSLDPDGASMFHVRNGDRFSEVFMEFVNEEA
ncbi:hypothetical protein L6452_17367 [Arctium lappa]|uniref:Uncharacterized protein n=1 Tax=Arctium lappa TaxID=4217 RepID=A0ACB9C384_ARCLA|nr:hypothetical protein L6452_17367 [Arctium lappa]